MLSYLIQTHCNTIRKCEMNGDKGNLTLKKVVNE